MVRTGEVSLWIWMAGLTVAGIVIFTAAMQMNQGQMEMVGQQMDAQKFSEIISKAKLVCQAGEGTTYPLRINIGNNVKAIYSAEMEEEPPEKVSVMISNGEMSLGNYLCIKFFDDDKAYCENIGCDVNMTYIGTPAMDENLASLVKEKIDSEVNAFEIIIEKKARKLVQIKSKQAIAVDVEAKLCGNGDVDSGEECDMNARTCEPLYGECSSMKCTQCKCQITLDCELCNSEEYVQGSDWDMYCNTEDAQDIDEEGQEEIIDWEKGMVTVAGDGSGDYNCAGATCEDEINQALDFVASNDDYTTVHLKGPYTFWIDDTIYIGGETILEGDSNAVIKLVDNAGWPTDKAFIEEKAEKQSRIVIRGFEIDGNCYEQDGIIFGKGYYSMIALLKPYEVSVYNMYMHDGLSDGIRIYHDYTTEYMTVPTNIKIHDNTIFEIGHDAVWLKHSSSADIYDNEITIKADAGVRLTECMDIKIHDNEITSNIKGFAGIEIDKKMSSTTIKNIEIYDNVIHATRGWGIWLIGYTKDGTTYTAEQARDVHIYHNLIYGTGTHKSYPQEGAIVIQGFDNTIIENNVIDDNSKYGIAHEVYDFELQAEHAYGPPPSGETFTTIVRNNIITNTKLSMYTTGDRRGYGIANLITNHKFVLQNNIVWNSVTANYYGVSAGSEDIQSDPQFADASNADYHLKSTFGRWSNGQWVKDSVMSPGIDAGYSGSAYSNEREDNGDRINIGRYGNTKEASLSGPLQESQDEEEQDEEDELDNYVADIVIDDDPNPPVENAKFYLTSNYANDAACIQAALNDAENGDTIVIREGEYQITKQLYQKDKSLNFIGEGEVTFDIHTGSQQGLYFTGSVIKNTGLSANAQKGATNVVLTDASSVRAGDLIKIWKNVQWCPLDYPEQTTGELYLVQSVSGNTVTLNEPLIREYRLSETISVEISRPIEMHVKNIRVQNVDPTGIYEGLMLRYCKDCSLTDSWFKDNGQAAVRVFTGFNVDVKDNEIYNCIHEGNGYGVSVAEASAFVTIDGNHIENCRHDIMSGTADFKALNRDIVISNNVLIGANIAASHVVDSHPNTIDYIVTKNKIYPKPSYNAFYDGTFESVFSENEIIGGHGAVSRRGNVNNGVHVIENNRIENEGYLYGGIGTAVGESLIIRNNYHDSAQNFYGVALNTESFRNIIISGNNFVNLAGRGVDIKYHINSVNVEVTDNTFENVRKEGVYIDGTSFTSGDVSIKDNKLTNVYPASPSNAIRTINIQNPVISGNQIS